MRKTRSINLSSAVVFALATALPAQAPTSKPATSKPVHAEVAVLGVSTRAPTKEECVKYLLIRDVRYQGQLVERAAPKGAAAKAGIAKGDVILKIDRVAIFSADDVRDVVSVRKPGQEIEVVVRRADSKKEETVRMKLGARKVLASKLPKFRWDYAGLEYLKDAIVKAKAKKQRVLIGLSGAGT